MHRKKSITRLPILIAAALCGWLTVPHYCYAEDFEIDGPSAELRRIQFCAKCQKALLVTTIPPGALIKCPHCQAIQRRIPTKYLLVKMYQVCPHCASRLDVSKFTPHSMIKCGSCGHKQKVLSEAIYTPNGYVGTGRVPDSKRAPVIIKTPEMPPPDGACYHLPRSNDPELPISLPMINTVRKDNGTLPDALDITPPGIHNEKRYDNNNDSSYSKIRENPAELDPKENNPVVPALSASEFNFTSVSSEKGSPSNRLPSKTHKYDNMVIVATVNGRQITATDIEDTIQPQIDQIRIKLGRVAMTKKGELILKAKTEALRKTALQTLIERNIILSEIDRRGINIPRKKIITRSDKIKNSAPDIPMVRLINEAKFSLAVESLIKADHAVGFSPTPDQVREYYKNNNRLFMQPAHVSLTGIVIFNDRERATDKRPARIITNEISKRLEAEEDFRVLADHYTEFPQTYTNHTSIPIQAMSSKIASKLSSARNGEIIGPIQLKTSSVFVKVLELRRPAPAPLNAVAKDIERMLENDNRKQAYDKWISALRQKADIQIY